MEVPVSSEKLLCIYYPGIVQNEQKMLQTLGGEKNISKVCADPQKRLELKWRPQDMHCKTACGNRQDVSNLLLKVRRRRKKAPPDGGDSEEDSGQSAGPSHMTTTAAMSSKCSGESGESQPPEEQYEYEASVLGIADVSYKFETLGDFQYLPMFKNKEDKYESLMPDVYVHKLVNKASIHKDVALHIPPPIFSRIDTPVDYCFREGPKHREGFNDPLKTRAPHLIGMARQRRPHFTRMFSFEDEFVPTEPMPEALEKLQSKVKDTSKVDQIRKLFEERPIWSKNAMKCQVSLYAEYYKYILPSVAYFCLTGPWRALWIKLGYDPRKDRGSKIYQLLDFRIRQRSAGDKMNVDTKRGTFSYHLPNTVTNKGQSHTALINKDTFRDDWQSGGRTPVGQNAQKAESVYIFEPDVLPPFRQMFYMMCDIHIPEIQQLVHSNDRQETVCTEKDGWCQPDIAEKIREILSRYLKKNLVKDSTQEYVETHNIPVSGRARPGYGSKVRTSTQGQSADSVPDVAMTTEVTGTQSSNHDEEGDDDVVDDILRDMTLDGDPDSHSDSDDMDQNLDAKVAKIGTAEEGDIGSEPDDDINEMETEMLEYIMDPSY